MQEQRGSLPTRIIDAVVKAADRFIGEPTPEAQAFEDRENRHAAAFYRALERHINKGRRTPHVDEMAKFTYFEVARGDDGVEVLRLRS